MTTPSAAAPCGGCGAVLPPSLLACPSCHQLVHAGTLKSLQADAQGAAGRGDRRAEADAWLAALPLLPQGVRQRQAITARLEELQRTPEPVVLEPEATQPVESGRRGAKWAGGLGTLGLIAWKLKFVALALLTKGKLLFLGLTQASTLLSMLLAFGVYWTAWGVWFAAGLVLSIYVHEMGHVAALRRFGVPASAPMFIPGVGAFVRMHVARLAPAEDARIGLAGPTWGMAAAALTLAAAAISGQPFLAAIGHTAAWLNLFNLLPVWQLDGNRGFAALSRRYRWAVAGTFAISWWLAADGLLALLALVAAVRALDHNAPPEADEAVALQFVLLIGALAVVMRLSALAAS